MKQTLAGEPVSCAGATIAEGIAVRPPGHITREIIRDLVDDIVLVSEECLERAIDTLITEQKLVVEGAGAAGFAAILANPQRFQSRKVGTVLCGGNIDARILASILMRGLVRQRRMVRLRIALTDPEAWRRSRSSLVTPEATSSRSITAACSIMFRSKWPTSMWS